MDYQTLYSMTQVSTEKKILAEEKIEKLKFKVEGTFINISEVEDIEDDFWPDKPHVMK